MPIVATAEVKTVMPEADPHGGEPLVTVVHGDDKRFHDAPAGS